MTDHAVLEALAELARLHRYSLLRYVRDAAPYSLDPAALETLAQMADMQELAAERLETLILDRDGPLPTGDFPVGFAAYHDLSLEYLLPLVRAHQESLIARIHQVLPVLRSDPEAHAVVEETLGEAIGHLETLEELSGRQHQASVAK